MADLDTNTAILIAVITALSVVLGGLITSITTYLIERQKSKIEAEKALRDKEIRELELRNQTAAAHPRSRAAGYARRRRIKLENGS